MDTTMETDELKQAWHMLGRQLERHDAINLQLFRDRTGLAGWGQVAIEDDGYNVVVVERHTREPLYAIEYGPEY